MPCVDDMEIAAAAAAACALSVESSSEDSSGGAYFEHAFLQNTIVTVKLCYSLLLFGILGLSRAQSA